MIIVTTIRINETPKLTVRAMTKVLDPSLVHCELHPSPFCSIITILLILYNSNLTIKKQSEQPSQTIEFTLSHYSLLLIILSSQYAHIFKELESDEEQLINNILLIFYTDFTALSTIFCENFDFLY